MFSCFDTIPAWHATDGQTDRRTVCAMHMHMHNSVTACPVLQEGDRKTGTTRLMFGIFIDSRVVPVFLWYYMAHRFTCKTVQVSPVLVCSHSWIAAKKPSLPGPHGWRYQFLAYPQKRPTSRVSSGPYIIQPIHKWLTYTSGSQVRLCWRHLLCNTSWNLCRVKSALWQQT